MYISVGALMFLVARKKNLTGVLTCLTGRWKNLDPTGDPTGNPTGAGQPDGFHLWLAAPFKPSKGFNWAALLLKNNYKTLIVINYTGQQIFFFFVAWLF